MALNNISLVGRLTADPELRYTQNGTAVSNFTLAVSRDYKDESGDRPTDFIKVVVWGVQAQNVADYTGKGHLISLNGRLETRSYENQDGITVYVAEVNANSVHFLAEPKYENQQNNPQNNNQQNNRQSNNNRQNNKRQSNNRGRGQRNN